MWVLYECVHGYCMSVYVGVVCVCMWVLCVCVCMWVLCVGVCMWVLYVYVGARCTRRHKPTCAIYLALHTNPPLSTLLISPAFLSYFEKLLSSISHFSLSFEN